MSTQITTRFTAYELSDEEVLQGSIFTILQTQVLQNHLATAAEEKLSLNYDPDNKERFLQEEAYLKAKLDFIQYLLDSSAISKETLAQSHQPGE